MLSKFFPKKEEKPKEPEITPEEKARQYKLQVRLDTINKLKEIKNLWLYLLHTKYNDRTTRRQMLTTFMKDPKFSEDLINEVIAYNEALAKEKR